MNFKITPANVMDNNEHLRKEMFKGLKGKWYGDKGYLSKLFSLFYQQGLHLVTKIRENMKNQFMSVNERL